MQAPQEAPRTTDKLLRPEKKELLLGFEHTVFNSAHSLFATAQEIVPENSRRDETAYIFELGPGVLLPVWGTIWLPIFPGSGEGQYGNFREFVISIKPTLMDRATLRLPLRLENGMIDVRIRNDYRNKINSLGETLPVQRGISSWIEHTTRTGTEREFDVYRGEYRKIPLTERHSVVAASQKGALSIFERLSSILSSDLRAVYVDSLDHQGWTNQVEKGWKDTVKVDGKWYIRRPVDRG